MTGLEMERTIFERYQSLGVMAALSKWKDGSENCLVRLESAGESAEPWYSVMATSAKAALSVAVGNSSLSRCPEADATVNLL